jgi:hypothetical protein
MPRVALNDCIRLSAVGTLPKSRSVLERNQLLILSLSIQDPDSMQSVGSGLGQRLGLKASAASRPRSARRVAPPLVTLAR